MQRILKHPFIRGGAIFSGASFIVSVLNYLFNLLVARSFSLADYGEYMAALSYVAFFGVPLTAMSAVLIQRVGRYKPRIRAIFILNLEQRLFSFLWQKKWYFVVVALIFGLSLYFKSGLKTISIGVIYLLIMFNALGMFYTTSLQASKKFFVASSLNVISSGIRVILFCVLISFSARLSATYALILFASAFVIFAGRRVISGEISTSINNKILATRINLRQYVGQRSYLISVVSSLGLIGIISADVILAKKFLNADTAGLYASLSLLSKIILYVAAPLGTVAFTFFTGEETRRQRSKVLLVTIGVLVFVGICSLILYTIFPTLVVSVIFGQKYLTISGLAWLAAVFGFLYSIANVLTQYWMSRSSWFATATCISLLIQGVGITIFHENLIQIMLANVAATSLLLLVYLLGFAKLLCQKISMHDKN